MTILVLTAHAHWIPPDQIVASLRNDETLRTRVGVRSIERQGRILMIRVDPNLWTTVEPNLRRELAENWYQVWRHNVEQGIVAVLALPDDAPLVNFDASGNARLLNLEKPSVK
ncbi:MAG: hypothetical protein N3C12_13810 [Candidatus Binatia bacterium]|nr:hypothetical protein [Candidatus Binatia bacterium]